MQQAIGYVRVSTQEQAAERNGLAAQTLELQQFAALHNIELIEVVEECASGALGIARRPVLGRALQSANRQKCMLLVSKLDRLSRDATFILNLMATKTQFVVTSLGIDIDPFMIHIYAVIAEKERVMIGQRTKQALAALKASGRVLGGPRIREAQALSVASNKRHADTFAQSIGPTITRMMRAGMSMQAAARELNANRTPTARGGSWTARSVCNVLQRL